MSFLQIFGSPQNLGGTEGCGTSLLESSSAISDFKQSSETSVKGQGQT